MNNTQKLVNSIKNQIKTLENQLENIQSICKHPNMMDQNVDVDDIFSDPFAKNVNNEIQEYICPDCSIVVIK